MTKSELCFLAKEKMKDAYSVYSGYKVGAALLTKSGKVYKGANVENSSYSATICAERVAFSYAVSNGEKDFSMIAIAGGKDGIISGEFPPCGICLQFMSEFCNKDFKILLVTGNDSFKEYELKELLPNGFSLGEQI